LEIQVLKKQSKKNRCIIYKLQKYIEKPIVKIIIVPLLIGVISSVAATIIVNHSIRVNEEARFDKQRIDSLNNLSVGINKKWVDDKFGEPKYVRTVNGFALCAYVTDDYMLQVAFDEDDSLEGYLITIINEKFKFMPNTPRLFMGFNKAVGEFSYADFSQDDAYDEALGSMAANGRRMYYEEYWGGAPGGYYYYYIASMDYGANFPCELTSRTNEADNYHGSVAITDRKQCYPNSIGVATRDSGKFDMKNTLLTIGWFDSLNMIYKRIY